MWCVLWMGLVVVLCVSVEVWVRVGRGKVKGKERSKFFKLYGFGNVSSNFIFEFINFFLRGQGKGLKNLEIAAVP